jgi:hypothetical protein
MLRELLIIAFALLVGFLATAAGGYLLHTLARSTGWSEPQLGALARYVLNPVVALLVGTMVGAFAKGRPSLLAAISLLPLVIVTPLFSHLDFFHKTILVFLSLIYVLLGATIAQLVFRARARTKFLT